MTTPLIAVWSAVLLHFVWQGALIALVYATVRTCSESPQLRHAAAAAGLVACVACPPLTLAWLGWGSSGTIEASGPPMGFVALPGPLAMVVFGLWSCGTTLLGLRHLAGVAYLRLRVMRDRVRPSGALAESVRRVTTLAGVEGARVWVAPRVGLPQVVGLFRPAVLLPPALAQRLDRAQLEAILLHELVHLRRRDPWFLALQHVAEVVLFYHPAVWWLSSQLRHEREFCCDAEVVSRTGRPLSYAKALVALETDRVEPQPALSIHGGILMQRIQRIVQPRSRRATESPMRAAAAALALGLALFAGASWIAADSPREDSGPIVWLPEPMLAWEGLLTEAGKRHQVDPALLSIVALLESWGNPDAESSLGALGLMQIMPETGRQIAARRGIEGFKVEELRDPATNLDFGAWLLSRHLAEFEKADDPTRTVTLAAAAYNGGPKAARALDAGVDGLSEETRRYVHFVTRLWLDRNKPESAAMKKRQQAYQRHQQLQNEAQAER